MMSASSIAVCFVFATLAFTLCEGKHDYKIDLKKVEIKTVNPEYASDKSVLRTIMFNDSATVIEGKLIVVKDLPKDLTIQVSGYQLSTTNQWIKNFDQGKKNYCDYLVENVSFMQNVLKASNFEGCPPAKGEWTLTNMMIDVSPFPESLAECQWKVNAMITTGMMEVLDIDVYAEIVKLEDDD